MSLESTKFRHRQLLTSVGKRTLNSLYPDDFEVYIFAFELVNSLGQTVEYFLFPINPSSYREVSTTLTTIKNTQSKITTVRTDKFIPIKINLSGNFGKNFKVILGTESILFSAISTSVRNDGFPGLGSPISTRLKNSVFSTSVKNGYGCSKLLQKLLVKSQSIDPQTESPYLLLFYNLALNSRYIVELNDLTFSQTEQKNGIWDYSIDLTAISKIEYEFNKQHLLRNLGMNTTQVLKNVTTAQLSSISKLINNTTLREVRNRNPLPLWTSSI